MMNPTGVPQPQNGYNQFRTANPYTAPPARQYEKGSSSNIPQMPQYYGHLGSQDMGYGRLGPPPELASQQQYPLQPQQGSGFLQPSAPPLQQFSSPPSSQYITNRNAQNLAALQPPPLQQYAGSQAVHQNPLPSYPLKTPIPNGHPVSHGRYKERDNTTSFRGAGGPMSGDDLRNNNGGNSGWIPGNDLSCQNFQGSLERPYDASFEEHGYSQAQQHRTEQSIMIQADALRGLDPWRNFQGQYRTDGTNENFGSNAGGDTDNQPWNSTTVGNSTSPGSQWSDSQEIRNQASPSTIPMPGIDPSLINNVVLERCGRFSADVDKTGPGESDVQNEYLLLDRDDLFHQFLNSPPTSTLSRSDNVSTETLPRAASNKTTHFNRRDRPQFFSGSSETTCKECDDDPECERKPVFRGKIESQKTSLRKHIHDKHSDSQNWSYRCLLEKDGSACTKVIELARHRRKHTESVHPTESRELPPKDVDQRNPNAETNAMLDKWFAKIPRRSSR